MDISFALIDLHSILDGYCRRGRYMFGVHIHMGQYVRFRALNRGEHRWWRRTARCRCRREFGLGHNGRCI